MRILYILEHYHPYIGGAERLFQTLAEEMVHRGHDVTVLTTKHDKGLASQEKFRGVKIHRLSCFNRYLFTVFAFSHLIFKKLNYDFIHTTTYNAALPAWAISKLRRLPAIITFHEYWGKLWFQLPFLNAIQRIGYFTFEWLVSNINFDHYIAVSEHTKKRLIQRGIQPARITRIYNGIKPDQFPVKKDLNLESRNFIFFGRLGTSKGLDLIIPAYAKLIKLHRDTSLTLIIPHTPEAIYKKIITLIAQHNLTEEVQIKSDLTLSELTSEILSNDAVLVPSYAEGFCFVAAESAFMGMPLIHSGNGALPEVVYGKNIQMTQQTEEALFEAMEMAYLGHWQTTESKTFLLDDTVNKTITVYEKWINEVVSE